MKSETKLIGTVEETEQFVRQLQEAIEKAKGGELVWASMVFEQAEGGPWRLVLGVAPRD